LKYNSFILLALSCVVGGLLIGLSFNVYAQTSNTVLLDDRNHMGQFSINNVSVSEKQYYKVIFMNIDVKVNNLGMEDGTTILPNSITLVNDNGTSYGQDTQECSPPIWGLSLDGKEGGVGTLSTCYSVEKNFNNFKVYYSFWDDADGTRHSYQIGNIDLTQDTNDQVQMLSSSPSNSSQSSSNFSSSNYSTSSTSQSATDIFGQLMNFLKQIFHFMILGPSFRNDFQR
jgi:hypothetical protein